MHRGVLHSASIELHIAVTLEIVLFRLLQSQEQYVVKQLSILNFKRGGDLLVSCFGKIVKML